MTESILQVIFPKDEFSEEERKAILPAFTKVEFQKGDYLLEEGQTSRYYWYVEEGMARSFAIDPNGNDVSTKFFSRGDLLIDWPSYMMRQPTKESIQALNKLTCWQMGFEVFQKLFHGIENFREAGRARLVKSYFELNQRTVALITDHAKDRYLRLLDEKPEIIQNVSLKQIASYLGITDTSLSRIRKEIAQDN